jgi:hypothetical protein
MDRDGNRNIMWGDCNEDILKGDCTNKDIMEEDCKKEGTKGGLQDGHQSGGHQKDSKGHIEVDNCNKDKVVFLSVQRQ